MAGLALGFLFLSLYGGILESLETLLFGSFLGITHDQVLALLGVAAATLLFFAVAGRPLLYASVDAGGRAGARRAGAAARARVPARARAHRRGDRPDHRRPARVRAARRAGRGGAAAHTSRPAGARAHRRDRTRSRPGSGSRSRTSPTYPVGFFVTTVAFAFVARWRGWRRRVGGARADARRSSSATRCSPGPRSRSPRVPSATSSCSGPRSSPGTRSAMSRSRVRSPQRSPASTSGSGLFAATIAVALLFAGARRAAPRRRRRDRRRLRVGARARRALPRSLQPRRAGARTASSPRARSSGRSSASRRARPSVAVLIGAGVVALPGRDRPTAPLRDGRPRVGRRPRRPGRRARRQRSSSCSGSTPAEATQAVGALLLLGLSPPRPAPPSV